jgi:hypothetical protein
VVYGIGVQLLNCWDLGCDSCWGHGHFSLVCVICCVGSGLCNELVTRLELSFQVCVRSRNLNNETAWN